MPPPVVPHIHQDRSEIADQGPSVWRGSPGYGQRHIHDNAPFSLWDHQNHDFRNPIASERAWVYSTFKATGINISFPQLVIVTAFPPAPVSLAVAGVAATFIVVPPDQSSVEFDIRTQLPLPRPILDPRPLRPMTCYVGPRVPDPLNFKLPRWSHPSREQMEAVVAAVLACCNARAISFLCPWLIVEICVDERVYEPRTLPGKFGGFLPIYHHQKTPVFSETATVPQDRPSSSLKHVFDTAEVVQGAWSCIDSTSTGKIWAQNHGLHIQVRPHPPQSDRGGYSYSTFYIDRLYRTTGCPAQDEMSNAFDTKGGVNAAAFYQLSDSHMDGAIDHSTGAGED